MTPRGFSLVELAVAVAIIALLLAGALIPLSAQIDVRNATDTRRVMDQVREALIGFAQANGRLPCPADGTKPSGAAGAGMELYTAPNCTTLIGVIPWATLGVPETDAWGRRFTYRVSTVFSDAISQPTWNTTVPGNQFPTGPNCTAPIPQPVLSSFALCSLGEIAVLTRSNADHSIRTLLGAGLPAVFVSHGKNGSGAFQPTGAPLAAGGGFDEGRNSSGGAPFSIPPGGGYQMYVFYSRNPTPGSPGCDDTAGTAFCEFDDIVAMISAPVLMARMVNAGRLP